MHWRASASAVASLSDHRGSIQSARQLLSEFKDIFLASQRLDGHVAKQTLMCNHAEGSKSAGTLSSPAAITIGQDTHTHAPQTQLRKKEEERAVSGADAPPTFFHSLCSSDETERTPRQPLNNSRPPVSVPSPLSAGEMELKRTTGGVRT